MSYFQQGRNYTSHDPLCFPTNVQTCLCYVVFSSHLEALVMLFRETSNKVNTCTLLCVEAVSGSPGFLS